MVGDIPIQVTSPAEAADQLTAAALRKPAQPLPVRLINAYSLSLSDQNPSYRVLLQSPGLNFPDGRPVTWLLRSRDKQSHQVRGQDLFTRSLATTPLEVRHYLLGTTADTLELLAAKIATRYPDANIVGTYAPPFGSIDDMQDQIDERISIARPHIVWVALGTPKQDFEARRLSEEHQCVTVGIGAAFQFVAGQLPTAPAIIQRAGLEWVLRLLVEPRRLWRRYSLGNLRFMKIAVKFIAGS